MEIEKLREKVKKMVEIEKKLRKKFFFQEKK